MALGTQLGKTNIAAWASKEEEDKDVSTSFKTLAAERQAQNLIETRATAWEEAEKAKFMARLVQILLLVPFSFKFVEGCELVHSCVS